MTMPQKLEKLRMIMKDQDCDAFIIRNFLSIWL